MDQALKIVLLFGIPLAGVKLHYGYKTAQIEHRVENAIVTPAQLGTVQFSNGKLNVSVTSISGLCNSLLKKNTQVRKSEKIIAGQCTCVIEMLPDYLYSKRVDEFKKVFKLRYEIQTRIDRTYSDQNKRRLVGEFGRKYDELFIASGLTEREYGQDILAVSEHVQKTCKLTQS